MFGSTRAQRCWVHKTANVLTQLPQGLQAKAKADLHEIWMAECRADAEQAFDLFLASYEAKYPKATECLAKDRQTLLTFYDFPAEHWLHLRTTNPIESTFATVRLRTTKTRGCVSRRDAGHGFQVDENGRTELAHIERTRAVGPVGPWREV